MAHPFYTPANSLRSKVKLAMFMELGTREISGMGGRSATLLTPMWRASPGKLKQLLLESTQHMVQEKKPLELFRR